eukprot:767787-Hanusia_phi.AAC.2
MVSDKNVILKAENDNLKMKLQEFPEKMQDLLNQHESSADNEAKLRKQNEQLAKEIVRLRTEARRMVGATPGRLAGLSAFRMY